MRFINQTYLSKFIEKKSEFITLLMPLESQTMISDVINNIKKDYPKASHYCSASITGENGEYATADDDGEPSRTAGIPILDVLKHHDVTNVLCVIVRYFGGTKLGAGGLVRAYSKGVGDVLKLVTFYEKKKAISYEITFPYHLVDYFENLFNDIITVSNREYLDNVVFTLTIKEDNLNIVDDIKHLLVSCDKLDDVILFVPFE